MHPRQPRERASSHQVCDPHNRDHVTVIERLLFCVLRASPDMVLFRRKGLAMLHETKPSFSDVTNHGILHRVIGSLRPRLHNAVANGDSAKSLDDRRSLAIDTLRDTGPT